jgi:hypothetical protein
LNSSNKAFADLAMGGPLLDVGAGDGALSFYFESLGYEADAIDSSGTNINRMLGIQAIASDLGSRVRILDLDLDSNFEIPGRYNIALMLGVLYHLKNPFYVLERLARRAHYCFLGSRVARFAPDHTVRIDQHPLAYLLDESETNNDKTNYWVLSPPAVERLLSRCGWSIVAKSYVGPQASDPVHAGNDERMFLLIESLVYE